MVSSSQGQILEVLKNGTTRILANTGGIPAGLQLDLDGSLLVADMKLGIVRVGMDGTMTDVVRTFNGSPIRGCNDLAFDSKGNLYFTAPAGSSKEKPCGEIFCRLVSGEVRRIDGNFAFCNGIAVSPLDDLLIVAETLTRRLIAYDLAGPGLAKGRRVFATLAGAHPIGADGIDYDGQGHLVATNCGEGRLEVYSPDGSLAWRVELPFDKPSNIHFNGSGSKEMLVTEHDNNAMWRFDYGIPGASQYGWGKPSDSK